MKKIIEFTPAHPIASVYQPEPIKKHIPEWYKNLESKIPTDLHDKQNYGRKKTIKKCVPVLDYMTSGYVIRAVSDFSFSRKISTEMNSKIEVINFYSHVENEIQVPTIGTHAHLQFPLVLQDVKKCLLKFNNFWRIKTPPGYSCLFYQPFYFLEQRFTILPGIVDTDEFNHPVSFPFYINAYGDQELSFDIKAGEPLVCVMPFKRDSWGSKFSPSIRDINGKIIGDLPEKELKFTTMMSDAYRSIFHQKKDFN
jgi:hypothetical protein